MDLYFFPVLSAGMFVVPWLRLERRNESQTVFREPCGVSRVDEQYPGPHWFMAPKCLSAT